MDERARKASAGVVTRGSLATQTVAPPGTDAATGECGFFINPIARLTRAEPGAGVDSPAVHDDSLPPERLTLPAARESPSWAAVFSFVWPGLGQLYRGRSRSAIVYGLPIVVLVVVL